MASTRPLNVADMASSEEPAAKRQKLTSGADLSSTVSNSPTANTVTSTTASLTGDASASKTTTNKMSVYGDVSIVFQPEKEAEHGILCFVSPSNPGFSGILKQRYTDFLVNEIMPNGTVVHLLDDQPPRRRPADRTNTEDATPTADPATSDTSSVKVATVIEKELEPKSQVDDASVTTSNDAPDPWGNLDSKEGPINVSAKTDVATKDVTVENNPDASSSKDEVNETKAPPSVTSVEQTGSDMDFNLVSADDELLTSYFGQDLKSRVVELYKKILTKPDAKPVVFGHLLTEPIKDRAYRGQIHQNIRRIFQSHLETESLDDGTIKITAAPRNRRNPQNRNNGASRRSEGRDRSGNLIPKNLTKGKLGWQELGGEYLHFTLYKENKDTMEVISYLCKILRIKPKDFSFAGTKDRRGVTVQRVSVFRQYAENIAKANSSLRGAYIGDFKYEKHGLELGELQGNHFQVTLRDCHFDNDSQLDEAQRVELANKVVSEAISNLQSHGFINYFGLQRFGSFQIGTDKVGKLILKGDFEGAVSAILTISDDTVSAAAAKDTDSDHNIGRDDIARAQAIQLFKSTGKSAAALQKLPRKFSAENAIIRHLSLPGRKTDYTGAILAIPRNLRTMYVHAYQSLVWNTVVSQRWDKYGGKVIKGDLVLVEAQKPSTVEAEDEVDENGEIVIRPAVDDTAVSQDDLYQRARPLTEEEVQSGKWTIFDIVLPTPGFDVEYPDNDIGDYYKEIMATERFGGLDPADMRRKQRDFSLSGSYRFLLGAVGSDLKYEIKLYHNDNEQLVETDLEKLRKAHPERFPTHSFNRQTGRFDNNEHRKSSETGKYTGTPEHNAWLNLPAKLAADDKAAAAKADMQRELYMSESTEAKEIKGPSFKETFIETNPENGGKRTGHRSMTVITRPEGSEQSGAVLQGDPAVNDLAQEPQVNTPAPAEKNGNDSIMEDAPMEPAKIAVIVDFSLGSSQYATMALRELMKAGNVKTYKPEFSRVG